MKNRYDKAWGYELWINNTDGYCGKLLYFNNNSQFSMHFHMKKHETWYCHQGEFELRWIDTKTAEIHQEIFKSGDIKEIPQGMPHQLKCISDSGLIFEVSDKHYEEDSYRVFPGDSQK